MTASAPARLPSVPPSVAEWEDLLLRMEVMQRVLRNTLEGVPDADAKAAEVLAALVRREAGMGGWLEAVSGVPGRSAAERPTESAAADARALADRFASLRARNFAMLQRRGLEVWRWTAEFDGHGEVSAYQAITWLVAEDVRALAALRERTAGDARAC
jgi:hypothetical protein